MEYIGLILARIEKIPTGLYLFLNPIRPCKLGKFTGPATGWELAPGVVAIGSPSEKAGLVPKFLRVDENLAPGALAGVGIGFMVHTPYGETAELEQLIAWAREQP